MTSVDRIERSIVVPASIDRTWQAITSPEQLSQWFAPECEFELSVGGSMRLVWESGAISRGVIEIIEPPYRFAFRWHAKSTPYTKPLTPQNSTVVTFSLEAVNGGTRVTVYEVGFAALPDGAKDHILGENTAGWDSELDELTAYIKMVKPE